MKTTTINILGGRFLFSLIAILFIAGASLPFRSFAQCSYSGAVDYISAAPASVGASVFSGSITSGNIYRITGMVAGGTYRVTNCGGVGESFDTQITIYPAGGGSSLGYNDDFGPDCSSGLASIDFTPSSAGDYDMELTKYYCQ